MTTPVVLIILSGLPGSGKTAIARELARATGAMHLRIDSIEDALRDRLSGDMADAGYRVAYAVAGDNLRIGRVVVADSVNPIAMTREAWLSVAQRAGSRAVEVEIACSDAAEHRRRVEQRGGRTAWQDVIDRVYEPWDRQHVKIDTAGRSVADCVSTLRATMGL